MAAQPSAFAKTFGNKQAAPAADSRPQAKFWLNIGYATGETNNQGNEYFVSTPLGLPVDTQEAHKTNASDPKYAQFLAAKNDLLAQLIALGESLEPGEARIVDLQVQLRRVGEEREVDNTKNTFIRKIA